MVSAVYDPARTAAYFDDLGDGEWDRLGRNPEAEVNFAVHAHYLRRYLPAGARVLEIGAGAGRFTIALAQQGCSVVVTDISEVQLGLNRTKVTDAGVRHAVESWLQLDVVDMRSLADDTFDAVVCYGGPLSYVMDRRAQGLAECVRVTRPGKPLLISVMCLWGSAHKGLPFVLSVPREANSAILASGDITAASLPGHRHECHAFRGTEFRDLLLSAGLTIEVMSAATCLSTAWGDRLAEVRADDAKWRMLLEMELAACAEPGCVEAGPHMIAVARKPLAAAEH